MKRSSIASAVGGAAAAGCATMGAYWFAIRPWHLRWGTTEAEIQRTLPGDEEVESPTLVGNRAVTIDAPPEDIWPWLVQIGKGRAGFYSYEWIENLMGLGIENKDRILPEFQGLKAGDVIPDFAPVKALEPNHFMLFAAREPWGEVSWLLDLEPLDAQHTRLISRSRYRLHWGPLLRTLPPQLVPFYVLFEPGEFVMIRKMLLGIKQRVERLAAERSAQAERAAAAATAGREAAAAASGA